MSSTSGAKHLAREAQEADRAPEPIQRHPRPRLYALFEVARMDEATLLYLHYLSSGSVKLRADIQAING